MRDVSGTAARNLGAGAKGPKARLWAALGTSWLKLARYLSTAFHPQDDAAAAAVRLATGGIGAPIVLPSACTVDFIHQRAESGRRPDIRWWKGAPGGVRRKTVLVLATDVKTYGGIQRYAQTWAQALFEIGYAPRTVVLWRKGVLPETSVGRLRAARFTAAAFLTSLVRRPEATICTHIGLSPVARLLQKTLGVPYAVGLHGDDSWRRPQKRAVAAAVCRADLLIPVSHFTREVVCRWSKIPIERTYVTGSILSPELELASARSDPEAFRQALVALYDGPPLSDYHGGPRRNTPGPPLILTVARLDANAPYKRHDLVVGAVARLRTKYPSLKYLIVGDGCYRKDLERLVQDLGLEDAVAFLGKVPEERLASLYREATCFAMPSRISLDPAEGEGFGLVYLEAGVWGVPSIAARGGGSSETVIDGTSGLLAEPDSLDSLVDSIDRVLSDPELGNRLGRCARVRALEFSYPRFKRRCAAVMSVLAEDGIREGSDPRSRAIAVEPEYPRDSLYGGARHHRVQDAVGTPEERTTPP